MQKLNTRVSLKTLNIYIGLDDKNSTKVIIIDETLMATAQSKSLHSEPPV